MIGEDYKTGTSYKFRVPLRDSTGALQTGKSATVTIYLPDDTTEASPPTVTELGASGIYGFSYAPTTSGSYTFALAATGCLPVVWTIQVRGLSRDDLAPEDGGNLAAVKQATDAYLDVAVSTRAAPGDAVTLTESERASVASTVESVLSDAHGASSWEGGAGSGTRVVVITVLADEEPVPDVRCRVLNAGGTTTAWGYTTTQGVVSFLLDDGSYSVYCSAPDYVFSNPASIEVSEAQTEFEIEAEALTPPQPSAPGSCACWCVLTYVDDPAPVGEGEGTMRLVDIEGDTDATKLLAVRGTIAETDANGIVSLDLLPGTEVVVAISRPWRSTQYRKTERITFTVPSQETYQIGS